jgi:GMP synthase (glutamine-hydrolysing)
LKIQEILHAPFESLGVIRQWAQDNGHEITTTRSYLNEAMPDVADFDWLLLMGGPQSVTELDKYPCLQREIALVEAALSADKMIWGVCLGAQIIGQALGATCIKSPEREVGVFPVHLTDAGQSDPVFGFLPETVDVAHWHGDMVGFSEDYAVLAKSEGCGRQIIRFKEKVYGLQCHFESKKEDIERFIKNCPQDLAPGRFVQSRQALVTNDYAPINQHMCQILDRFCRIYAPK